MVTFLYHLIQKFIKITLKQFYYKVNISNISLLIKKNSLKKRLDYSNLVLIVTWSKKLVKIFLSSDFMT